MAKEHHVGTRTDEDLLLHELFVLKSAFIVVSASWIVLISVMMTNRNINNKYLS